MSSHRRPLQPDPHPSEQDWAAFLAAELGPDQRERLDRHLLLCGACWHDLNAARHGRDATIQLREYAPDDVRRRLTALTYDLENRLVTPTLRRHRMRPVALIVAAASLVAVTALSLLVSRAGDSPVDAQQITALPTSLAIPSQVPTPQAGTAAVPGRGSTVRTAVNDYLSASSLSGPGTLRSAPDLTSLALVAAMAGSGTIGDHTVTTYSYLDDHGRRLVVLLSATPFPRIRDAENTHPATAWTATTHGLTLFADNGLHPMLIVSADHDLTMSAGAALT